MTINELIHQLECFPPDLRVVVDGYEDGYDDLSPDRLRMVKITLNTGTREYVGIHGSVDLVPQEQLAGLEIEKALALHRTSY